jgi:hypothetical protein
MSIERRWRQNVCRQARICTWCPVVAECIGIILYIGLQSLYRPHVDHWIEDMNTEAFPISDAAVSVDSAICSRHQGLEPREKISRKRSNGESKSSSGTKCLRRRRRRAFSARSNRSRKGWSAERRARQAALIRSWAPWRRSTGPKTGAGKARSAMNALKHGGRSQAKIREYQRIRYVLRLAAQNIERVRLLIRLRDARPRIKYKFLPSGAANTRKILNSHLPLAKGRWGAAAPIRKPRAPTPPVSARASED